MPDAITLQEILNSGPVAKRNK